MMSTFIRGISYHPRSFIYANIPRRLDLKTASSPFQHTPHDITCTPRRFSSDVPTPTIDLIRLESSILSQTPEISKHLSSYGYYTTTSLLPIESISILRSQAVSLRKEGRYVPSFSEKIEGNTIKRFDKEGVYACEPDGGDYYAAPDLISYIGESKYSYMGTCVQYIL